MRSKWKLVYDFCKNKNPYKIISVTDLVKLFDVNHKVSIYNGKVFFPLTIRDYMIGYSFASFIRNKKTGKEIHKKKKKKKQSKKKKKINIFMRISPVSVRLNINKGWDIKGVDRDYKNSNFFVENNDIILIIKKLFIKKLVIKYGLLWSKILIDRFLNNSISIYIYVFDSKLTNHLGDDDYDYLLKFPKYKKKSVLLYQKKKYFFFFDKLKNIFIKKNIKLYRIEQKLRLLYNKYNYFFKKKKKNYILASKNLNYLFKKANKLRFVRSLYKRYYGSRIYSRFYQYLLLNFYSRLFFYKKINLKFVFVNLKNLSAHLISKYIVNNLLRRFRIIKIVLHLIQNLKKNNNVKGIMIYAAGRFNRKQRASFYKFFSGSLSISTLNSNVGFDMNSAKLKYGVCGIKVWLNRKLKTDNFMTKDSIIKKKIIYFNVIVKKTKQKITQKMLFFRISNTVKAIRKKNNDTKTNNSLCYR